ncbi:metallophosphoesterase [Marinagarivorans algicola]|uniref:metallophosphoesterase n=1 Tax=Marinagarivorans algicola TaxID=1513270 RepID=UPI0006B529D4|nr:metallophosphoesterase [Marinagarivorans algicola]
MIKPIIRVLLGVCLISASALADITINQRISSSDDDAEERSDGSMYLNSSDIELVYDGSRSQTIGLRFQSLAIAQGATITGAYVQFTTDETNTGNTVVNIRAENSDNAAALTSARYNLSRRATTNANVTWRPASWRTVGAAGTAQRTPELKAIIQEVVDRSGWQSGNDLALIITGIGERTAESFDGSSAQAPLLHITYQTNTGGNTDAGGSEKTGTKIAFIGDTGAGRNFQSVLNLIQREGADFTIVAGDTSYNSSKDDNWDAMVRNTLGSDPAVIAAGNHDYGDSNISDVIAYGKNRLNAQSNVQCSGIYAEKMTCQIDNVYIVLSAIGSSGRRTDHENYISRSLNNAPRNAWRICAWHKNQRNMQAGGKYDEVGWTAYETCRQNGAIIATGHEHSYSRTHLLSDMSQQTVASTSSRFVVSEGETFAFVSGLGGIGVRDQERSGNWWASIYTSTQGARYGAMFGTFYEDRAEFYFKNVNGQIIDQFTVLKGY